MEVILKCKDCGCNFVWHNTNLGCYQKQLCPKCAREHKLASKYKWGQSPKGKMFSDRFEEKRRALCSRRNKENLVFKCPKCGKDMNRRSLICKVCYCKLLASRSREEHPNWKGGIVSQGNYLFIYLPEHPRASHSGYVLHHIYVWEQFHHKPLPDGWIIHHLNGIKKDNRLVNLVALPNKKHFHVLQAKTKRIQELEALLNHQPQLI